MKFLLNLNIHMKKMFSIGFVALLLMSMATVAIAIEWDGVPDDPTPSQAVWVDPKNTTCLSIGQTFVVDVLINITSPTSPSGTGLFGWEYKLSWDTSVIDTDQANSTTHVLPGTGFQVADDWTVPGRHVYAWTLFPPSTSFTGVTSLCTYNFTVVGSGGSVLDLYETEFTDDTATIIISDTIPVGTTADGIYCTVIVPQYELTIGVVGNGTTVPAPGSYMYDEGSVVSVDAVPDAGWMLDHWELDGVNVGAADPISGTINADHELIAFFVEIPVVQYELTIGVVGNGTTVPAPGSYMYDEGSVVSVDAVPDAGYMLDHWELDTIDVGADDPYNVTMDANHTLTAVFVEIPVVQYELTIGVVGNGTTVPAPGSYMYDEGSVVSVDAVPDAGYMLDHWELDTIDVGADDPYNVTMDANHTLTAVFADGTPPRIRDPSRTPSGDVQPDQDVKVSVNVTDYESGVKNVTLTYTTDNVTWTDIGMVLNATSGLYEATIPGKPALTLVRFNITAYDNAEKYATKDGAGVNFVYRVIPEFPSFIILPLFMVATLVAVILAKTARSKKRESLFVAK